MRAVKSFVKFDNTSLFAINTWGKTYLYIMVNVAVEKITADLKRSHRQLELRFHSKKQLDGGECLGGFKSFSHINIVDLM